MTNHDSATVVAVEGELDLSSVSTLQEALAPLDPGSTLVIDLTRCTFLDSSAVRALVATAREADEADGSLALVAADPGVLRVLEITAVDTLLPVHTTIEDAL